MKPAWLCALSRGRSRTIWRCFSPTHSVRRGSGRLLFGAHQAKDEAEGLVPLKAYWAMLAPVVPNAPVMWTTASEWTVPSRAYLLGSPADERSVVPLLERLGVPVVHPDVAGHVRRMSGWAGAQEFTLTALTAALAQADSDPPDRHGTASFPRPKKGPRCGKRRSVC